jgi:hypothetical protein
MCTFSCLDADRCFALTIASGFVDCWPKVCHFAIKLAIVCVIYSLPISVINLRSCQISFCVINFEYMTLKIRKVLSMSLCCIIITSVISPGCTRLCICLSISLTLSHLSNVSSIILAMIYRYLLSLGFD